MLVFGSPKQREALPGVSLEEATKRFRDGFAQVAPHAEQRGVTLLVESLPTNQCNIVNTVAAAVEIVDSIGSPAVQTMFDTHNALDETEPHAEVMKALGASNWDIQQVFLFNTGFIALAGILIGTAIGLGICLLQQQTGFIRLNEEAYFIREAQVLINGWQVLFLMGGTLLICMATLIIPTLLIRKVNTVKAIQFR